MIAILLRVVLTLASSLVDARAADGLRDTAPDVALSRSSAADHLAAARFAAAVYRVDAEDLLAIAYHESRYTNAVTREPNGVSCGALTPYDRARARCPAWTLTTLGGYLHGAAHLAEWRYRYCRGDRVCALRGYSGNQMDRQEPGARAWVRFTQRAARIRRAVRS